MQCKKVTVTRTELLDPLAPAWNEVPGDALTMDATPLANQPSEYIKASRDARQIGKVKHLTVQTMHNGADIFFRLAWEDASQDTKITDTFQFPDGCGILMPLKGGGGGAPAEAPPIDEMGSKDAPVNAWFWRADQEDKPHNTVARGLGTTTFSERCPIVAKSVYENAAWAVVLARPLAVPEQLEEVTQLAPGATVKVGFAVWEGSNGERAGLKSFSKEWLDLSLEA